MSDRRIRPKDLAFTDRAAPFALEAFVRGANGTHGDLPGLCPSTEAAQSVTVAHIRGAYLFAKWAGFDDWGELLEEPASEAEGPEEEGAAGACWRLLVDVYERALYFGMRQAVLVMARQGSDPSLFLTAPQRGPGDLDA